MTILLFLHTSVENSPLNDLTSGKTIWHINVLIYMCKDRNVKVCILKLNLEIIGGLSIYSWFHTSSWWSSVELWKLDHHLSQRYHGYYHYALLSFDSCFNSFNTTDDECVLSLWRVQDTKLRGLKIICHLRLHSCYGYCCSLP